MKGTSPWCIYLVRLKLPSENISREYTKSKVINEHCSTGEDAQDSIRRSSPMFSQPIDEPIECPKPRFSDVTRMRRPTCFRLEDLFSPKPRKTPSSTGPALLDSLLSLSSTASTLVLRCESLVANKSCARGTLQVRELCIKAVRKAIKG
jgi:hypothetical protein